jgi:hypothetical protein
MYSVRNQSEALRLVSSFPRRITVRVVDRSGFQIPDATIQYWINGEGPLTATGHGQANIELADDLGAASVSVKATYEGVEQGPTVLSADQSEWRFQFDTDIYPLWRGFIMKHFSALVGIFFILLALVLVFVFDSPTPLQTHLVLAMFALGGGGFGGEVAGFIKTSLTLGTKLKIAAGGAAAIFVVLYFFIPAGATP